MSRWIFLLLLQNTIAWELTLLHVNDIHVRMEETNKYSASCRIEDKERGKCFGGLARLHTAVKQIKEQEMNVLWLNAGDFFQGTVWYSHFKWKVVARFNTLLNFDVMTLGNHEFDDGIAGLVPFLLNQTVPFVVSNMNTLSTPSLTNLTIPSIVITRGGRKIGVVGYLTPETKEVSNPGMLEITDEIEAVRREVEKLHNSGVDIIIGLGHSGYEKDLEIADKVAHIDLVVGGHTHSFLYNKDVDNPSNNIIEGPYPTIVNNSGGALAAVVQAYAYTKYLGRLNLKFNELGHLVQWSGRPLILDKSVVPDKDISEELSVWRRDLDKIGKDLVGSTKVVLFNTREGESNIGNFVTDAMVWAYRSNREEVRLAMVNSGGIRASFDKGNITMEDLLMSFPFRNTFDLVLIRGVYLRKVFENSVAHMKSDGRNQAGRFLQVSGFRLVFDLTRPTLDRLELAEVPCSECPLQYKPLEDDVVYEVVMTDYLAGGGDGFTIIRDKKDRHLQGPLDSDILREYIKSRSPLTSKVEDRIYMRTINSITSSGGRHITITMFFIFLIFISSSNL